jgi:hypothetical protein
VHQQTLPDDRKHSIETWRELLQGAFYDGCAPLKGTRYFLGWLAKRWAANGEKPSFPAFGLPQQ